MPPYRSASHHPAKYDTISEAKRATSRTTITPRAMVIYLSVFAIDESHCMDSVVCCWMRFSVAVAVMKKSSTQPTTGMSGMMSTGLMSYNTARPARTMEVICFEFIIYYIIFTSRFAMLMMHALRASMP